MSDNKNIKWPLDSSRINIHETYEVVYWCKALGVTKAQLEAAVKAVGTSATAVRKYLDK